MSKTYSAGIVTAYGAAKRAGYQGTYEDFCRQQAGYAESAAAVERAKNTAVSAANTATTKAGEAATAATAAQTAKTQTEAAASQALTDISTARSGAISAVRTEGQTQTANARAQAQAAAQSATTASTKASEASASATTATTKATEAAASATSAANAASAAQGVLESIPENYSDMSEDVDKLKADLADVKDLIIVTDEATVTTDILNTLTWTSGYMGINGLTGTASNLRYSNKMSVSKGDVLNVLPNTSAFRFVCAFDGDTPVSASGAQNVNTYTVPDGIDGVVFTAYVPESSYAATSIEYTTKEYTPKNIYEDDITELTTNVNAIGEAVTVEQYQTETETDIIPTFTNGYMNTSGNVNDSGSASYFDHTQKIPVQAGDEVSACKNETSYDMRFVCAFNGESVVASSGWDNSGGEHAPYVVPEGIDGVVVSVRVSYRINTIKVIHRESAKSAYAKPIPLGYMMEQGSLADGETLTLPHHNVKNDNIYIFNANIDMFEQIKFVKETSFHIEVDSTNLYITNDSTIYTVPHGLSISDNITLMICNETSASVSLIRVSSNGQEFSYTTPTRFLMDANSPKIQSIGSTLSNCTFSWVSKNVNAPIWLFGDSYFSWYENRWTYYLARDGYTKNCLLNGYAGEASASAYSALINLLAITTPKIVVWCMGMNDGDSESAVNANWERYYNRLIELSKEYGFELVLYTVPTTPIINNMHKNAIVRDSGYRYIEADLAVRIDDNGNWIPGALNEGTNENPDNVHPTPMGAKIIYYRVISDLPEIMCNT